MSNLLYIPNGYSYSSLSGINFNTFNPSVGFTPTYIQSSYGWNNINVSGLNYNQNTLLSDIQGATQSGETNKGKFLSALLVYGPTVAAMVAQIILATKGKSITNPNQVTDAEAAELLQKLNGNFSPDNINKTYGASLGGSTQILGINLSTIVIVLGGVILFQLFTQNQGKKK